MFLVFVLNLSVKSEYSVYSLEPIDVCENSNLDSSQENPCYVNDHVTSGNLLMEKILLRKISLILNSTNFPHAMMFSFAFV